MAFSFTIHPIPAFDTNYIWAIIDPEKQLCAIVDPGDAQPVIDFCDQNQLTICDILITHHHRDHTGGIEKLRSHYSASKLHEQTSDATSITTALGLGFDVMKIPGHTLDHVAYYNKTHHMLFCGDTLFAGGCGRVFEGTMAQMYDSLQQLASLPDDTQVFCAHEYTLDNLKFGITIEPDNQAIHDRLSQVTQQRADNECTLPSTIGLEKRTNVFLLDNCNENSVEQFAQRRRKKDAF